MSKKSFLIGFAVLVLASTLFSQKAYATTCEEQYLKDNPGGTVPITDPTLQSNCSSITSKSGDAIHLLSYNHCSSPPTWYTSQFCKRGTPFTTYSSGEVVLYSEDLYYRIKNVGGDTYNGSGPIFGVATGIMVNAGEPMNFWAGEYDYNDGLGWRTYSDAGSPSMQAFFNMAEADAATKGYTVIALQTWADQETASLYDTYDFDDLGVVIAIKKTIVDCNDSDVVLSSSPSNVSPLTLGVNTNITLTRTGTVPLTQYVMGSNNITPVNAFGCAWSSLQGKQTVKQVDCTVDRKPPNPATAVLWTHTWCNTNNASCNPAVDKICSASLPLSINPYGPYLKTDLGTSYIRGNLELPRFPLSPLSTQTFSKYIYSTAGTNTPVVTSWLSSKNYLLMGYNDNNGRPDFYAYLKSNLNMSAKIETKSGDVNLSDANYSGVVGDNDVVIVEGNLTLSSANCNSKTIFFVTQNLYIDTNFNTSGNNACLFVVDGETLVRPAVSLVKAFVITNKFTSQESTTQLVLNGGLIIQTSNTFSRNYNRDITEASDLTVLRKTTPSELFNYEGARYLKLLGFLLNGSSTMTIRETQYVKSSN